MYFSLLTNPALFPPHCFVPFSFVCSASFRYFFYITFLLFLHRPCLSPCFSFLATPKCTLYFHFSVSLFPLFLLSLLSLPVSKSHCLSTLPSSLFPCGELVCSFFLPASISLSPCSILHSLSEIYSFSPWTLLDLAPINNNSLLVYIHAARMIRFSGKSDTNVCKYFIVHQSTYSGDHASCFLSL